MSDQQRGSSPSILLEFRGENIRSLRDPFHLSLLATTLADKDSVRRVPWREDGQELSVLTAAALFGANGSGKTNVLKAMDDMQTLVVHSFRQGRPSGGVPRKSFMLDPDAREAPSRFEVDLILDGIRWEYGFVVDNECVREEWAYRYPRGRAALVFHRHPEGMDLGPADRAKGRAVGELLRPNALFLSTAASANHPTLQRLYGWFERNLLLAEADSRPWRQALTTAMLNDDDPASRERVLALLRAADLGITGARKRPLDPETKEWMQRIVRVLLDEKGEGDGTFEGPDFDQLGVQLVHRGADGDVELEPEDESLGTRVWFGIVGPVIRVLSQGSVFLADELDASLHPALVAQLIRLFRDHSTNPRRAQLIFNSHDASLLGGSTGDRLLGRDQIWFTEKDETGGTRLYPLADLDPRKEEAVGKRYLAGRYGAVPLISHQEFAAAADLITSGDRD